MNPDIQKKLDEAIREYDALEMGIAESFKWPRERNKAILEIRAGAGGDEAALFAMNLFKMYQAYSAKKNWAFVILDESKNDLGGYKEVTAELRGKNVYDALKYESGVHRIQRVPATEKSGRIHTSTASVAILPFAEAKEVEIKEADLEV